MRKITGLLIFICLCWQAVALAGEAKITIESSDLTDLDTLELLVWNNTGGMLHKAPHRIFRTTVQNGICTFTVDKLEDIGWMSLNLSYQKFDNGVFSNGIYDMLPIEKEDNVYLRLFKKTGKFRAVGGGYIGGEPVFIGNWGVDFLGGMGYQKMEIAYSLKALLDKPIERKIDGIPIWKNAQLISNLKLQQAKAYLNRRKNDLSDEMYRVMLFEIIGKLGANLLQTISIYVGYSDNKQDAIIEVKPKIDTLLSEILTLNEEELIAARKSPAVLGYWNSLIHLNTLNDKGESNRLVSAVYWVNNHVRDVKLRDQLWLELMLYFFYAYADVEIYDLVINNMQSAYGLQRLHGLEMLVNPVAKLEFDLPDDKGKRYTMQDFKGKVLLIDFWYMACIPCRVYKEKIIKPLLDKMKGNPHFQVVLISLDDEKTLQHLVKEGVVPDRAISLYTDNLRFKHPLLDSLGINAYPYPMLINQEGGIVTVGKRLRNMEYLLEDIDMLLYK